jgi:hypothetical protein
MFGRENIRLFLWGVVVIIVVTIAADVVMAQVPNIISYQGRLTTDAGEPLNGTFVVTFALYSDSTATTRIWKEVHDSVTVEDGLFTVLLGTVAALEPATFGEPPVWLGIALGGEDLMTPLTQITSTAYAYQSENADYANAAGHADTANVALSSGSGWKDLGSVVTLTTLGDSVGINTEYPMAPLHVKGEATAILGYSLGTGNAFGVYGVNEHDGIGVFGVSDSGVGVHGFSPGGFGGYFMGLKNYFFGNVGVGTEDPDEMMHLYTDQADSNIYMKIQSAHATNWGAAGIQFNTPENIWYLRMGNHLSDQVPSGGLGLHQIWSDDDVMTWTLGGKVGIGNNDPAAKLGVACDGSTTVVLGRSYDNGTAVMGLSEYGYGGYFVGDKNYFSGNSGFGTHNPTHLVTINGSYGLQHNGTTEFHIGYYNGGLDFAETSVADYRLFIKDGGNVGIGTGNPTEKLYVNGNTHVAGTFHADDFETDAIDHTNIVDEIGIASAALSNYQTLATTYTPYLTREITVPAAGYILAIGWAKITLNHSISGYSQGSIVFSEMPDDPDGGMTAYYYLGSNVEAGSHACAIPCQRLFYAPAAGTYTYYMLGKRISDNDAKIEHRQMDLLFIPTVYSSQNGKIEAVGDNDLYPVTGQLNENTEISHNIKTNEPATDIESLESRLNSLLAEAAAIKNEIEGLKEE